MNEGDTVTAPADLAERIPYAWPITRLPPEFDTPAHRVSPKELAERLRLVELLFSDMETKTWRHYTGDIYRVTGFGVSARDGQIEVQYTSIGNLTRATFHLPIHEWFVQMTLPSSSFGNPNLVSPDNAREAHRFTPVFSINRYETMAQIGERGQ